MSVKKKSSGIFRLFLIVLCLFIAGVFVFYAYKSFLKTVYPIKYTDTIASASEKYGLEPAMVYGVIKTESGFNEAAISPVGARGLMQLMPKTFEWLREYKSEDLSYKDAVLEDLERPEVNIDYGCCYLSFLQSKYESKSACLAAYNAGPGNVDEWLENPEYSKDGISLDLIPFDETAQYVKKVLDAEKTYLSLYYKE